MQMADIFSELDDHGFDDVSPTRMLAVVQDTVWQLEGLKPWPFLGTVWTLNFDGTHSFPSNWASLTPTPRASSRLKDLSNGRRILPVREEEFEDLVGMNYTQIGNPTYYYFIGSQLNVWPIPAAGATLRMSGYQWSAPLTTSSPESAFLIPPQFHRSLIVNGALQRLYAMEDDTELAPLFQSYQSDSLEMAVEALFKQQYDRGDRVRVTDADSWEFGQEYFPGPMIITS
jgi:hypothetical protein